MRRWWWWWWWWLFWGCALGWVSGLWCPRGGAGFGGVAYRLCFFRWVVVGFLLVVVCSDGGLGCGLFSWLRGCGCRSGLLLKVEVHSCPCYLVPVGVVGS